MAYSAFNYVIMLLLSYCLCNLCVMAKPMDTLLKSVTLMYAPSGRDHFSRNEPWAYSQFMRFNANTKLFFYPCSSSTRSTLLNTLKTITVSMRKTG